MRRWLWIAGLVLFAHFGWSASEGEPAPELMATMLNGETFSMTSAVRSEQVVVVHFWATWCAVCKQEMPVLDAYFKKHRSEGFRVLAISMDKDKDESVAREQMKAFSFDGALSREASFKSYGRIWRLPLTFVTDRHGILRRDGWSLGHALAAADLEAVVTPLLKPANSDRSSQGPSSK